MTHQVTQFHMVTPTTSLSSTPHVEASTLNPAAVDTIGVRGVPNVAPAQSLACPRTRPFCLNDAPSHPIPHADSIHRFPKAPHLAVSHVYFVPICVFVFEPSVFYPAAVEITGMRAGCSERGRQHSRLRARPPQPVRSQVQILVLKYTEHRARPNRLSL